MSKKLENYNAKYCCMTKLDPVSSRLLKEEIDSMININMYDQYFEDGLVQMIMFHDFQLFCRDIAGKKWSEKELFTLYVVVSTVFAVISYFGIRAGH